MCVFGVEGGFSCEVHLYYMYAIGFLAFKPILMLDWIPEYKPELIIRSNATKDMLSKKNKQINNNLKEKYIELQFNFNMHI